MSIPSTVDGLPPEIKSEVDRLLIQRVPLDRILTHLRGLSGATVAEADLPSRSALGRYAQRHKGLRDRLSRSREMAVAIAAELGDAPGSQQMAMLTELLQTAIFDLMVPEDGASPELKAGVIAQIAKSLKDITTAARGNIQFIRDAEQLAADRATKAAAEKLERGLTTVEGEAASAIVPPTPEQMIARIRALYAGEG